MLDMSITDDIIRAEIHKAELWIDHHEAIRNRSLDLNANIGLALGIDMMRSHLRDLVERLRSDNQQILFGDT